MDWQPIENETDIEDEMIRRGMTQCDWCMHWKKKGRECPRCWAQWHKDEPLPEPPE